MNIKENITLKNNVFRERLIHKAEHNQMGNKRQHRKQDPRNWKLLKALQQRILVEWGVFLKQTKATDKVNETRYGSRKRTIRTCHSHFKKRLKTKMNLHFP